MTTPTTRTHRRQTPSPARNYMGIGILLLIAATFVRFFQIGSRPGTEWDEPVYTWVGRMLADHGEIQTKTEILAQPEPYLYHPPFYYGLLAGWFKMFGEGITQARVLAAIGSIVTLALLWVFLLRLIGNWALLAVGLIAFDGWMVLTNRISWIENTMMPLGVLALYLYHRALLNNDKLGSFALAGFALGALASYKHHGIYFLLAVVIHWIIVRRYKGGHVVLLGAAAATIGAYLITMFVIYGDTYARESGIQVLRSLGKEVSRGSINGLGDVVEPLMAQYKIYVATVIMLVFGGVLLVVRTVKIVKQNAAVKAGPNYGQTLLYSWALAGVLLIGGVQVKLPQYFMMAIVPMYCFIVSEAKTFAEAHASMPANRFGYGTRRHIVVGALAVVVMLGGLSAASVRFYGGSDQALGTVSTWVDKNTPIDTIILTEESVGTAINRPYCKLWRGRTCVGATYLILYTSHTQQPPTDNGLPDLILSGTKVFEAKGYKETLTVLRLPRPVGQAA